MELESKFEFGDKVRDTVTNFEGTVTAIAFYMNGCVRYQVQPALTKDKTQHPDSVMFDEQQLELVKVKQVKIIKPIDPPGGDRPDLPGLPQL